MIEAKDIVEAANRIKPFVHRTPCVTSGLLNNWLGHRIIFKAECLQKIGAFKARGACNAIAKLVAQGETPTRIIANSSGNHAQAVAWAAAEFGVPATIYMASNVSKIKAQATRSYGAEIIYAQTRAQVDELVAQASREPEVRWIPPFNDEDVIAGQGTAAFEALEELGRVDAVFAPCGGGGLVSGTLVASRHLCPGAQVIGVEPLAANDAAESLRKGEIQTLARPPETLADGAATPAVGDITFPYLKQLDDFFEADESSILYWTQWLTHLLKLNVEPTSAMAMDGVCRWLAKQAVPKTVLVILSGGNIDQQKNSLLWQVDYLSSKPSLT